MGDVQYLLGAPSCQKPEKGQLHMSLALVEILVLTAAVFGLRDDLCHVLEPIPSLSSWLASGLVGNRSYSSGR